MTLTRISARQARRIDTSYWFKRRRGFVANFGFKLPTDPDDARKWELGSQADSLLTLTSKGENRSLEIWVTSTAIRFAVWSETENGVHAIINHFRNFNPDLVEFKQTTLFPALKAGNFVRAARLRMLRCAHHPLEWRFGTKSMDKEHREGMTSPVVHMLNSLPKVPDGSTLIVQFLWRKMWYGWTRNHWTHWDPHFWRGRDWDAIEWKRKQMDSYIVEPRLLEIHSSKAAGKTNHCKIVGKAFTAWKRQQANRWQYKSVWTPMRTVSLARAMRNRTRFPFRVKRSHKTHLAAIEMASIIHPPPRGAAIPNLLYTKYTEFKTPASQQREVQALQTAVMRMRRESEIQANPGVAVAAPKERPVYGGARQLSYDEVQNLMKRDKAGSGKV